MIVPGGLFISRLPAYAWRGAHTACRGCCCAAAEPDEGGVGTFQLKSSSRECVLGELQPLVPPQ